MKAKLFSLLLMLFFIQVSKAAVEIDGINYNLNTTDKTAEVVSKSSKYSGDIVISESVEYDGEPYLVTSIGGAAFKCCYGLTSIIMPNSVTSIGGSAFYDCSSLKSITIPNSVTSIGNYAFSDCIGLKSIAIPNSVTSIGNGAFYFCIGLTSITIPNSVTSIGENAFSGCSSLTSITIPNSVTSIGNKTFDSCRGLSLIDIPNSVTSIGECAFSGCSSLTSIIIPNSVTSIGECAFSGCSSLASITIPNSVTSIGNYMFSGCNGLTSVTVEWDTPLALSYTVFYSNSANATLYVPEGTKAAYEAADYWKDFKDIVEIVLPKCATPTVTFADGKLHFECETEGVKFHYSVTTPTYADNTGNDVPLSATYTIQVYASKDGYKDSDVATEDINVAGLKGDVNSDGEITAQDASLILQYIAGKTSW